MLYHANQLDAVAATRPVASRRRSPARARREPRVGSRRLRRAVEGADARHAARAALGAGRRARVDRARGRRCRGEPPDDSAVLLAIPAAFSGTLGLYAYYRGMAIGDDERRRADRGRVGDRAGAVRDRDRRPAVARSSSPGSRARSSASCSRRRSTRRAASGASQRASWLAVLAAIGFGFYFPPMHAAGEADPWWASLIFRITRRVLVLAAVGVRRSARAPRAGGR